MIIGFAAEDGLVLARVDMHIWHDHAGSCGALASTSCARRRAAADPVRPARYMLRQDQNRDGQPYGQ
jgi:hypothetical protein